MKNEKFEVEDILIINVLGLVHLRDGNLAMVQGPISGGGVEFRGFADGEEIEVTAREYGFGSPTSRYRDRRDRRCARARGHRCGKK
jgi:hypothetical protein